MARQPKRRREALLTLPGMVARDERVLQPRPAGPHRRARHEVQGMSQGEAERTQIRGAAVPSLRAATRGVRWRWVARRHTRKGVFVVRHMLPDWDPAELDALIEVWIKARAPLGEREGEL